MRNVLELFHVSRSAMPVWSPLAVVDELSIANRHRQTVAVQDGVVFQGRIGI